jgi:hypothetical protein
MGSPREILAIVAMGASLVAFTALGSAHPRGKAVREDGGCQCCNGADDTCRSDAGGQSTRGTILLARGNPGPAPEATSQQKTKGQAKAGKAALAKGIATRKALLDQVSALMEDGVADCCIDPGCAFCVIAADGCPCAGSLAKGGPVCPECWGGWRAGQGMLPDVQPEKVQVLPKDQLKTLYGMKAEKLEQAGKK